MKTYLVGGAVRDRLLKREITERDWVVVGAMPEELLRLGYQQVGKDFPVFLHPETKEEYALARKERKVSKGYKGFEFDAGASVTLEEDLARRDLTINAIAENDNGSLVDPYHGADDIQKKILRHVSPAFIEDPVRILRVARFAARFPEFTVAEETNTLMKAMVSSGEVDALVAERVWKEFEKALSEKAPWRFFEVLHRCGALGKIFPELQSVYQSAMDTLRFATSLTGDVGDRLVITMQVIKEIAEIEKLCEACKVPKQIARMASLVKKFRERYLEIKDAAPEGVLNTLQSLDAFRRDERFQDWLRLCQLTSEILEQEDSGAFNSYSYCYRQSLVQLQKVALKQDELRDLKGQEVGQYIYQKRLDTLKEVLPQIKRNFH